SPNPPLIRIEEDAPARPEVPVILTPGARPAKVLDRLLVEILFSSSTFTAVMAPVKFTFFWVPYPTITTSSKAATSSLRVILMTLCVPTSTVWETYPIKENTDEAPSETAMLYFPDKSVAVPMPEPGMETVTPGMGSPFWSTTVPETVTSTV